MKNSFGSNVIFTIFGESHGDSIGGVLDGIPAGIKIDYDFIKYQLSLRRPYGLISTSRVEADEIKIVSGVNNGITCGTPICLIIENKDTKSDDYKNISLKPRPSHADYTAFCKYGESGVLPGGGHFSGRITASIVALGAIAISILNSMDIKIGSHIKKIGDIEDRTFNDFDKDIKKANSLLFSVLDDEISEKMQEKIKCVKSDNDSIGGIIETAVIGVKAGVGEPWFDTIEGVLSHSLFSIPAVKGVEFGLGFDFANSLGSKVNDEFYFENNFVRTKTNNSGGILGGISNGEPIVFRVALKPTPTISKDQNTVDLLNNTNTQIAAAGRHDPCIVHRARVVVDSITALTLLDLISQNYGTEGIKNAIRADRENT